MSNEKLNISKNNSTNTTIIKQKINNNTTSKNKLYNQMNQYANSYNLILSLSIIVPLLFFLFNNVHILPLQKKKEIKKPKRKL